MKKLQSLILLLMVLTSPAMAEELAPRNTFEVSYEAVQDAVAQALVTKGVGDKVSVVMNGHTSKPIYAYSKPLTIDVRGLQYDATNGRWQANLVFMDETNAVSALPASGHFDQMVEVAVLRHEVRTNELIREADVEVRDFPVTRIRGDMITDLSGLIGKAPVHTVSPFRPLRTSEVANPAVMKKDALIDMRYHTPGMDITAQGQAMMNGAKGDVITVRNINSKKVIRAVVEDAQTVNVVAIGGEHAALQ